MAREQIENLEEFEPIDIMGTVFELRKALRKFFIPIILFIGLCSFGTYYYTWYNYMPVYEATASFVISTNMSYSSSYYDNATAEQMGKTFPYIVTSGVLRNVVAKDLGLSYVPSTITAEVMQNTNLFTIHVTDTSASRAYQVLQSVIENYPSVSEYIIGSTSMTIVDESGQPTTPKNADANWRSAAKGGILAAAIVVALLLVYVLKRKTIRSGEDLQKVTSAKFLGNVPITKIKKRSKMSGQALTIDNPKVPSNFKEAVRLVRSRLAADLKGECPVILVTSAVSGEGRTTIAANLAIALSRADARVALIDGDLRHPNLRQRIGLPKSQKGLPQILRDSATINDTIVSYKGTRLGVIGGNTPLRRPVSFIRSNEMNQLISDLKLMVDYIVIDTPACSILSDTAAYSEVADCAVMVVRQDFVDSNQVRKGLEMITDANIPVAGCIINCVDEGNGGYGYSGNRYGYRRYGYGYGYGKNGYGYGYGQNRNPADADPDTMTREAQRRSRQSKE